MPVLSITREERAEQPILLIRRRIPRTQLQGMLAECFGKLFMHCQTAGIALAGAPWESYVTDPGEHPNPADWRTEVFWPLGK